MNDRLQEIRNAYDLTVEQYRKGIDPLGRLPEGFRNSDEFREFLKGAGPGLTGSDAPENRQFLDPQPGMRFLDAGCCANLANYRFDSWPSVYYGVDISPNLIHAMRGFAARHKISVGGLEVAELAALPFDNDFFDIASVIGVLEYANLEYCRSALLELHRVLKNGARMVVDIPNLNHAHVQTMFRLEEYLGRPNIPKPRVHFEQVLAPLFTIVRVDDSRVMLKYFVRRQKGDCEPATSSDAAAPVSRASEPRRSARFRRQRNSLGLPANTALIFPANSPFLDWLRTGRGTSMRIQWADAAAARHVRLQER